MYNHAALQSHSPQLSLDNNQCEMAENYLDGVEPVHFISRLNLVKTLSLKECEKFDFDNLKKAISSATLQAIDESLRFTVEFLV